MSQTGKHEHRVFNRSLPLSTRSTQAAPLFERYEQKNACVWKNLDLRERNDEKIGEKEGQMMRRNECFVGIDERENE